MRVVRRSESGLGNRQGFSFVEVLIVLVILAALGSVAIGARRSVAPHRVESAASEIANALRFARQEAMRRAEHRVVWVGIAQNRVGVYEATLDAGGNSVAGTPVDHPIDRRPWVFDVDELPLSGGVRLSPTPGSFMFSGAPIPPGALVVFDEFGLPGIWVAGTHRPLAGGSIGVELDSHQRTIALLPTGRVTLQ